MYFIRCCANFYDQLLNFFSLFLPPSPVLSLPPLPSSLSAFSHIIVLLFTLWWRCLEPWHLAMWESHPRHSSCHRKMLTFQRSSISTVSKELFYFYNFWPWWQVCQACIFHAENHIYFSEPISRDHVCTLKSAVSHCFILSPRTSFKWGFRNWGCVWQINISLSYRRIRPFLHIHSWVSAKTCSDDFYRSAGNVPSLFYYFPWRPIQIVISFTYFQDNRLLSSLGRDLFRFPHSSERKIPLLSSEISGRVISIPAVGQQRAKAPENMLFVGCALISCTE